jgi:hypothetical protein
MDIIITVQGFMEPGEADKMVRVIEAMHPEARVRVITDMRVRPWVQTMEYKTTTTAGTGVARFDKLPELEF